MIAIAIAFVVVINQRAPISLQRESLDQQNQLAAELKQRNDEATRLRQQEATFAMPLKALDAKQARNAASAAADQASQAAAEQRAQGRQRLEAQIKALQERWNATCTSGCRCACGSGGPPEPTGLGFLPPPRLP